MVKKALALFLTIVLCISCSAVAFADDFDNGTGGSFNGNSGLETTVYKVSVPLTYNFAVDAVEIQKNGQLYCGDNGYGIVNRTASPVLVSFNLTVTANNGAQFVNKIEDVDRVNIGAEEKNVFIGIQGASDIDAVNIATATGGSVKASFASSGITDANLSQSGIISFASGGTTSKSTSYAFLVKEGTGAAPTDKNSLSAFRLYGALTTYPSSSNPWAAGDISFTGSYSFQVISPDHYTTSVASDSGMMQEGTLNMYKGMPKVGFQGVYAGSTGDADRLDWSKSVTTFENVYYVGAGIAADKIKVEQSVGTTTYYALTSNDYTYTNGMIKIKGNGPSIAASGKLNIRITVTKSTGNEVVIGYFTIKP